MLACDLKKIPKCCKNRSDLNDFIPVHSLFGKSKLLRRQQRWLALTPRLLSLQDMWEILFNLDMNSTKGQADVTNLAKTQFCGADPTDLLQTRAQVAAENVADPVYFHTMDAGLCIAFLHPLQVGLLLVTKLSEIKRVLLFRATQNDQKSNSPGICLNISVNTILII